MAAGHVAPTMIAEKRLDFGPSTMVSWMLSDYRYDQAFSWIYRFRVHRFTATKLAGISAVGLSRVSLPGTGRTGAIDQSAPYPFRHPSSDIRIFDHHKQTIASLSVPGAACV